VEFDSSTLKLESAPFQIISSGTEKILNHEVYIRSGIFIPNYIEVQKGDRVIMINDDGNNTRTIKANGVLITKLAPRDSYSFPVSQSGKYEFGLAENAISKLTVEAK
jgi:plastocyanin